MNEQIIILILTIVAVICTLWLYIWRAVKQVKNRNDERWNLVLLKAKSATELSYWVLMLVVAILISKPEMQEVVLPLKRILLFAILFFGFRNFIELLGLFYYERKL